MGDKSRYTWSSGLFGWDPDITLDRPQQRAGIESVCSRPRSFTPSPMSHYRPFPPRWAASVRVPGGPAGESVPYERGPRQCKATTGGPPLSRPALSPHSRGPVAAAAGSDPRALPFIHDEKGDGEGDRGGWGRRPAVSLSHSREVLSLHTVTSTQWQRRATTR